MIRKSTDRLAIAIIILLASAAMFETERAFGDELYLANGDHITGHIVSIDEDRVEIRTSYGDLVIDRKSIVSGTFSAPIETPKSELEIELLFNQGVDDQTGDGALVQNFGVLPAAGVDGVSQSAIRTTGEGTYIQVNGSDALNSASDLTVSFWISVADSSRLQYILSKWKPAEGDEGSGKFAIGTRYSGLYIYLMDPDGNYHFRRFDNILSASEWTHIAVVFDRGLLSVYENGVLHGQHSLDFTALNEDSSPLYIMTAEAGTDAKWTQYNVNGYLDGLRIYTRALSEADIEILAAEYN